MMTAEDAKNVEFSQTLITKQIYAGTKAPRDSLNMGRKTCFQWTLRFYKEQLNHDFEHFLKGKCVVCSFFSLSFLLPNSFDLYLYSTLKVSQ